MAIIAPLITAQQACFIVARKAQERRKQAEEEEKNKKALDKQPKVCYTNNEHKERN